MGVNLRFLTWFKCDAIHYEKTEGWMNMPSIVERAGNGHRKSMTILYTEQRAAVYLLCRALLDKEPAAEVAAEVMNGSFAMAKERGVKSEDAYGRMLLAEAARRCALQLLDGNAPQTDNITPQVRFIRSSAVYAGDLKKGSRAKEALLGALSSYQRFAYVAAVCGLTYAEIGEAMGQREAIARYCVGTAAFAVSRVADGGLRSDQLYSLLEQEAQTIPAAMESLCMKYIAENSKRQTPLWKILVPIACVAVVAAAALVVFLPHGTTTGNNTGTTTGSADTTDTAVSYGAASGPLDSSLTYYADIAIQDYGTVTVKLDTEKAPITCANFVALAQNKFYDGLTFHRIIEDFMMQGGDPDGDGTGGSDNTVTGEFSENGYEYNTLSHTRGAISMARSNDNNSGSSQFFIVHEDSTYLDGSYAAFGYVTEGMDVVDAVCESAEPTDTNGTIPAADQPVITSVTIRTE